MAYELPVSIVNVWDKNLAKEVNLMTTAIENYPYVAMDTEFPGKAYDIFNFDRQEIKYRKLKANVDRLKIIQIGITLFDKEGNLPIINGVRRVWQFNFREFNIHNDSYDQVSIDMLKRAGHNFGRNLSKGISAIRFSELLMCSNLVSNKNVHWVTFHGGYDCGYWIRMLTGARLPITQEEFYTLVKEFFPVIYDLKHVAGFCRNMHGGLEGMSRLLGIERNVGIAHQAGSDSFLTFRLYRAFKNVFFQDLDSPMGHDGVLELS